MYNYDRMLYDGFKYRNNDDEVGLLFKVRKEEGEIKIVKT